MIMQTEKVKKLEEQVYQLENKSENLAYAVWQWLTKNLAEAEELVKKLSASPLKWSMEVEIKNIRDGAGRKWQLDEYIQKAKDKLSNKK
jgi:hypothetical protein